MGTCNVFIIPNISVLTSLLATVFPQGLSTIRTFNEEETAINHFQNEHTQW